MKSGDSTTAANRLVIDVNALRAGGYLPEVDKDRQFADHYRRIKRPLIEKALSGDNAGGEPRIIMVASAVPGDGKTFTSINLALSMALERDISVLLVDSDVAKHHITDIFGLRERKGLAGCADGPEPGSRDARCTHEFAWLFDLTRGHAEWRAPPS